jgi:cell division protein FtsB
MDLRPGQILASLAGLVALALGCIYALGALDTFGGLRDAGVRPLDVFPLVPLNQVLGRGIAYTISPVGFSAVGAVVVYRTVDRFIGWERLLQFDRKDAEREAAAAEIERLRASEAEIERDAADLDAEGEALKVLVEIRRAVAGEVRDAGDVDAVRAALGRLFSHFTLYMPEQQIKARIRPDAIELVEDIEGGVTRKLRREPISRTTENHFSSW